MSRHAPLLDRVADLSAIRDPDLLDLSLLRTVDELCAPRHLALLRASIDGRPASEISLQGDGLHARLLDPVDDAALLELLDEAHGEVGPRCAVDGSGATCLYPLLDGHGVRTSLCVGTARLPGATERALILGFSRFFQNYRGLLDDAQRDALTGLRNRKTFDETVLRLFAVRDAVEPDPDAPGDWLGVLDIDHFKRINDGFGHLYGDEVLLLVARLMRDGFRGNDLLFRFGGEEFVVILRDATRDEAVAVFERFRSSVADYGFPQVGRVTLSAGVVRLAPGRLTSLTLDEADKALYWAKQHGRNRLAMYDELIASGALRETVPQTGSVDLF